MQCLADTVQPVGGALKPGTWTVAQTTKGGTMHIATLAIKRLSTAEEHPDHIVLSAMTAPEVSNARNRRLSPVQL